MVKINQKSIGWALSIWIAFVFIQSLFFKFSGAPETVHIFTTIGTWMNGNFLSFMGDFFISYGAYTIGTIELIASVLLLIPMVRIYGAIIAFGIITGAIFFHLATPLGVVVNGDGGTLFVMAVTVFVSSIALIFMNKNQVLDLISKKN